MTHWCGTRSGAPVVFYTVSRQVGDTCFLCRAAGVNRGAPSYDRIAGINNNNNNNINTEDFSNSTYQDMTGRICVLILHLMLLSSAVRVKNKVPRSRPCLDLPEEILEQMFGRLSVGIMNAFHHTLQLAPLERRNLTCPSAAARPLRDAKSRISVNSLSVSPWAYRITHDSARYPRYIPEAYCLCKGCLTGPQGEEESDRYRSTPVYSPSVILKRTGSCVGGRHSYTESYVSIPVGCTCVPLLEKDRDGHKSNQSMERMQLKAGELSSVGKNV